MSLSAGYAATSADIKALKTKIDNEMYRRRSGKNPYGQGAVPSSYWADFSQGTSVGDPIRVSQYNETVGRVSHLFTTNLTYWPESISSGTKLGQLQTIWDFVDNLSKISAQATSHGCRGECTGLCYGTCQASCEEGCTTVHGNCSNRLGGSYPCGQ